jgi:hypothetical protein
MVSRSLALDRHLLDALVTSANIESTLLRIHEQHHVLARKLLLDGGALEIDLHAAMRIDLTREGLPIYASPPAVGINLRGRATAVAARQDERHEGACFRTNAPDVDARYCHAAESPQSLLVPLAGSQADGSASTPGSSFSDPVRRRHGESSRCGGHPLGSMPTHSRKPSFADGKSRPEELPTHLGSRSKVSMAGRPSFRRKWTTASKAGSRMKILMCLRTEKDGSACIDKVEDLNHPAFVCLLDRREQCSRL